MSTFANGLYPDQNVGPNLNPTRLTPGWFSYKIFFEKKLVLKKNILVRLRKQNIRFYCFDESTIQQLDHCLATPKTGSYTRNREYFPEYEICNEQVHEVSNNVICATSKASDQPAHTRSLIRTFASRLSIL